MAKMWWKRKKTFAMLANKRQWEREFDPTKLQQQKYKLKMDFI